MSIHTPILKDQKSAEEECDPWDFKFMTLQKSEETLEIGCLSPQQIKLRKDQVHQIKNMKAKKGDEMNLKQKDALIELMQYYSESCKYTGDPSKLSYILEQFSIGYMNQIDLLKALNQVKDLYTQMKLDNFVANFKYEYEANENPIENIERYKMKNEIDEILKFTDNVIYYKQQMIKQNKMLPQPPLVYLNMATVAPDGTVNESYKHSKLYQNQPQLCEVARIASRLLIQIYQHDERFVIDEEDFKRVGIVFDDQDKQHQKKLCERHGQGKDLERENNQRAQSKIQDFNQKLRETKKIPFQKQMKALIDVIRNSQDKEFVELRKKLQDSSKGRDFKFEDLRKLNPLIFLKDKEIKQEQISDEIYQQIEIHLKDQLFNQNKICQFLNLPQSKEIKLNYIFLESFVKTILPEFDLKDIQQEIQQKRKIQKNKNDSNFQVEEIPIETPTALYNDVKDMYKSKIQNEKIEIFKEKYKNSQFFDEQKKRYQNPKGLENSENNFYEELQKQKGQIIPVFNKIQNKILDLSGYPLDSKVAQALSGYIKNKSVEQNNENFLIKKLLIDQIGLTDTDFSQILSSIEPLNSIQQIVYKNSEFFQKSFSEFLKIILKMYSKDCSLEIIHFSKLKTDKFIIEQLLQKLDENPKLKVLKLQNLDLNTVNSAKYIGNQFQINASLTEVDISGCRIFKHQLNDMVSGLALSGAASNLTFLNLSNINIYGEESNQNKKKINYSMNIIKSICSFIESNSTLKHLDMSGMNLKELAELIIASIQNSIERNKCKILSVHLNENDFSASTKYYIIRKLRIETHEAHKETYLQNVDQFELISAQNKANKARKVLDGNLSKNFFGDTNFQKEGGQQKEDLQLMKHEIEKQIKNQNNLGIISHTQGTQKQEKVYETFILNRKISHPELIFKESCKFYNLEFESCNLNNQWSLQTQPITNDNTPCYVCQSWPYIQVYFGNKIGAFQRIEDNDLIQNLTNSFELEKIRGESPVLISTLNGWNATRMVDVRVYCQLLKTNITNFGMEHVQKLRNNNSIFKQQIRSLEGEYFDKMMKEAIQKRGNQKGVSLELQFQKKEDIPSEILKQYQSKQDSESISKCTQNILDSVTGKSFKGMSKMLQILEKENPNDQEDSFLFDKFTKQDWRYINTNCHLIPYLEIQKVNYLAEDVPYVYAGYVKPGRHVIIIYMPQEKAFYQQEINVSKRNYEIEIYQEQKVTKVEEIQMNPTLDIEKLQNIPEVKNMSNQLRSTKIKSLNTDLKLDEKKEDVVDCDFFIFKNNLFLTPSNLNKIIQSDFHFFINNSQQNDKSNNPNKILHLNDNIKEIYTKNWQKILDELKKIYKLVLNGYKMYLLYESYPDSSFYKLANFLKQFNLISIDEQKFKIWFLGKFQSQESFVINRANWIIIISQVIFYSLLKQAKDQNDDLLIKQTFQNVKQILENSQPYQQKFCNVLTEYNDMWRKQNLWTQKVNLVFVRNMNQLKSIYDRYGISNNFEKKFTIQSALNLLKVSKINLEDFRKGDNEDLCVQLFGLSKSYLINDLRMYSYQNLQFPCEFCEFIARLAMLVYPEEWAIDDQKSIYLQMITSMQLSYKIFELLKMYLLIPIGGVETLTGEGPVFDAKAERRFKKKRAKQKKKAAKLAQMSQTESKLQKNDTNDENQEDEKEEEENLDGPCMVQIQSDDDIS